MQHSKASRTFVNMASLRLFVIILSFSLQTPMVIGNVVRGALRHSRIKGLSGLGVKGGPPWIDDPNQLLPDQVASNVEKFPKPYSIKDERRCTGYSIVGCVQDKVPNYLRRWYHNRSWTAEEDEEPMSPDVCYKFCRYVEGAQFFGLVMGTKCYCTPYFEQGEGSKGHCDEPCEGDPQSMCGGAPDADYPKSNIYSLHDCNNTPPALCTHAPPQIQKSVVKISPIYGMKPTSCLNLLRHVADSDVRRTCEVECLPGYTLMYNDLVCEEKGDRLVYTWGQFQGSARCGPISCGVPPDRPGARAPQQKMYYDSPSFFYTCLEGHTSNGDPGGNLTCEARCQKDGSFTETEHCKCEAISCSRGGLPYYPQEPNAYIVTPKDHTIALKFGPAGYILYRCNSGFTTSVVGSYFENAPFKRLCMPDGTISNATEACTPIKCGPKPEYSKADRRPMNGDPTDDPSQDNIPPLPVYYYPTMLEYDCKDGYSLDGLVVQGGLTNEPNRYFTLTCKPNGEWEKNPSSPCIGVRCGVPTQVANAHPMRTTPMRYDVLGDTDEELVRCYDGYTTNGQPSTYGLVGVEDNSRFIIKCGIDGNFFYREDYSGIPTCDPVVCGVPPVLPNAVIQVQEGKAFACGDYEPCDYTDGENSRPKYQCQPGYGTDVDDDPFSDPPFFFNRCKKDGTFENNPTDHPPVCKNINNCKVPVERKCGGRGTCVDKDPPTGNGGQYDYYCNCSAGYIVVPPEAENPPKERTQHYDEKCKIINNCPLDTSFAYQCKSLSRHSDVTNAGSCVNKVLKYECDCIEGWTTTQLKALPLNETCAPISCGPLPFVENAEPVDLEPWLYGQEIREKTLHDLPADHMAISRPAYTYTCLPGFSLSASVSGATTFSVSCEVHEVTRQVQLTPLQTCQAMGCGSAYTTPNSYMSRNAMTYMFYHPVESERTIDYRCREGYTIGQLDVQPVAQFYPGVQLATHGKFCCPSAACEAENPDLGETNSKWTYFAPDPDSPEVCGNLVRASTNHADAVFFMYSKNAPPGKKCWALNGVDNTLCEQKGDSTLFAVYSFLPLLTLPDAPAFLQTGKKSTHQHHAKLKRSDWECNTTIHTFDNDVCFSAPRLTNSIVTTGSCVMGDCQDVYQACEVEGGHVATKAELAKVLEVLTFPDKMTTKFITSTRNVGGYRWLAGIDAWHFDGCCGADDRYFICVYTPPERDLDATLTRETVICDFTAEDQVVKVYVDGIDVTQAVGGGGLTYAGLVKTVAFASDISTLGFYVKTTTGGCDTGGFAMKCKSDFVPWNIDTSNTSGWKVFSVKGADSSAADPWANCYQQNFLYEPVMVETENVADVAACQAQCASHPGCVWFTYFSSLRCTVSDITARRRPSQGSVSGPTKCPANIPEITERPPQVDTVYWYQPGYVAGTDFKDVKTDGANNGSAATLNVANGFCGGGTDPTDNHLFFLYHHPSMPVIPEQPPLPHAPRNFTAECQATGNIVFQPHVNPTCSKVKCGIPATWSHATVSSIAEMFYRDQVIYTCDPGYSIDATADNDKKTFIVLCQADAFFSPMQQCKPISCGTTQNVSFTTNNRSGQEVVFASSPIGYTCFPGFSLDGTATGATKFSVTCTESGHFQVFSHLACRKISCGDNPTLPNADAAVMRRYYQDVVVYNCSWGYSLDQLPVLVLNASNSIFNITCLATGQFSPHPECKPVQCTPLPVPFKATLVSTGNIYYGEDAKFECQRGWSQDGKLGYRPEWGVSCQPDGTFAPYEDCKDMDDCVDNFCALDKPDCENCTCSNLPDPVGGWGVVPPLTDYKCDCIPGFRQIIINTVNTITQGHDHDAHEWSVLSEVERVSCAIKCDRITKVYVNGADKSVTVGNNREVVVEFTSDATRLAISNDASVNTDKGCAVRCDSEDPRWRISTNSLDGWTIRTYPHALEPGNMPSGIKWYENYFVPDEYMNSEGNLDVWDTPSVMSKTVTFSGTTTSYQTLGGATAGQDYWSLVFMSWNGVKRYTCENIEDCHEGFCMPPLCVGDACICNDLVDDYECHCPVGFYPDDQITRADGVVHRHDCVPQLCPDPVAWGNATANQSTAPTYKDVLIYTCDDGYTLDGTANGPKTFVVPCRGRSPNYTTGNYWMTDFEECKPVDCGVPPEPGNTQDNYEDRVVFPIEVTYTCLPGYSTDRTCDAAAKTYTIKCNASGVYEPVGGELSCLPVMGLNPTATDTPGFPTLSNAFFPNYSTCVSHCPDGGIYEPNSGECVASVGGSSCGCTSYKNDAGVCMQCPAGRAVQDPAHTGGLLHCRTISDGSGLMYFGDSRQARCTTGHSTDGQDDQLNKFTITVNTQCGFDNNIGCQILACGSAPGVTNADGPDPTTSLNYGETASYTAQPGYSLGGEPDGATQWTAECMADGNIVDTNKSQLQPIKCYSNFTGRIRAPPVVANAGRSPDGKHYPQTVEYRCNTGYAVDSTAINLGGQEYFTITCQADGTYSTPEDCLPVSCGDPAAAAPWDHVYIFNEEHYCCQTDIGCGTTEQFLAQVENLGNTLTAEACGIKVKADYPAATFFMWNKNEMSLRDQCLVLRQKNDECTVQGSDSRYTIYTFTAPLSLAQVSTNGSRKTLSCVLPASHPGYDVSECPAAGTARLESQCVVRCAPGWGGEPTRQCNVDGGAFVFNGCRVVPFPPMFADRVNGTGAVVYNNRAYYQCKGGWTITGQLNGGNELSSRCLHTGAFGTPTHTCLDIDDCVGNSCTPNGDCVNIVPPPDPYTHFDGYRCDCHAGYHPVVVTRNGVDVKTCNNTNDCPDGACIPGGACKDGVTGYTCECGTGYYMWHNPAITQTRSGLTIPSPGGEDCAPQNCDTPPPVANGQWDQPNRRYVFQEVAGGNCNDGYSTTGAPDGDKRFDLECKAGSALSEDGVFETPHPVCNPVQCSTPPDEDNADYDQTQRPPDVIIVYPQQITYTCHEGYSVDGACNSVITYTMQCNSAGVLVHTGDGTTKSCQPVKAEVTIANPDQRDVWKIAEPTLQRWKEFLYQDRKVFTCQAGYVADPAGDVNMPTVLHVTATKDCSFDVESYYKITPASGEKPGACPQGRALTEQECKDLAGHPVHNSVSHAWGDTVAAADESCGCYVNDGDNLLMFNPGPTTGTCDPDANEIPICKIPDADRCYKISCGIPPAVPYGTCCSTPGCTCPEKRYKETVTYTALTGYTLTGDALGGTSFTVECLATGLYDTRQDFKRISCGKPDHIARANYVDTTVNIASAEFLSEAKYQQVTASTCTLPYQAIEEAAECTGNAATVLGVTAEYNAGSCGVRGVNAIICVFQPVNRERELLYEDSANFECHDGYTRDQLVKNEDNENYELDLTCQLDGTLVKGPTTNSACHAIKCPVPTIPATHLYGTGTPNPPPLWYYYEEDNMLLYCKPGYSISRVRGTNRNITSRCMVTGQMSTITQCLNDNDCDADQCEPHGDCVDKDDPIGVHLQDYYCDCDQYYTQVYIGGVPTCIPDDHCQLGGIDACIPGVCVNLIGDFECDCPKSHYYLANDRKSCHLKQCDVHDITHSSNYIMRGIEYRTYYPDKANPPAKAVAGDTIRYTCDTGYTTSGAADGRKRFQILCHGNGTQQAQLVDRGLGAPVEASATHCFMDGEYLTAHSGGSCMFSKPDGRFWTIDYTQKRFTMYQFKVRMTEVNGTADDMAPMGAFKPCNVDAKGVLRGESPELNFNARDGYKLKFFTNPTGAAINGEYTTRSADADLSPLNQAEKTWVVVMEWKPEEEVLVLKEWDVNGVKLDLYDGMVTACPRTEAEHPYAFTPRVWAYDQKTYMGIRDFEVYQKDEWADDWVQQTAYEFIQTKTKRRRRESTNRTKLGKKSSYDYVWWVDVEAHGAGNTECFRTISGPDRTVEKCTMGCGGGDALLENTGPRNTMQACKDEYEDNPECKFITWNSANFDCFCMRSCSDRRDSVGWSSARRETMEDIHVHGSAISNYQCSAGYEPLQTRADCQFFLNDYDNGLKPLGSFIGTVESDPLGRDEPGGCVMTGMRPGSTFKKVRFNQGKCQCANAEGVSAIPMPSCALYPVDPANAGIGIYHDDPCLRKDESEEWGLDFVLCKPNFATVATVCAQLAGNWDVNVGSPEEYSVTFVQTSTECEGRVQKFGKYSWVFMVDGHMITNLDEGDAGTIEIQNGRAYKITWLGSGDVYTKPVECKPVVCQRGVWPIIDYSTSAPATDITYGQKATFTCTNGYSTLGSCDSDSRTTFTATCNEEGVLVFDDLSHKECIGNFVGEPSETQQRLENARYTPFNMSYPDEMEVFCLPGYETRSSPPPAEVTCRFTMQQNIIKVYLDGVDKTNDLTADLNDMAQVKTLVFSSKARKIAVYGNDAERGCATGGFAMKCTSDDIKWAISTQSPAGWKVFSKQAGPGTDALPLNEYPQPDMRGTEWYQIGYHASTAWVEPEISGFDGTPSPESLVGATTRCAGIETESDNHLFFTYDISIERGSWGPVAGDQDCEMIEQTFVGSGYLLAGCKLQCQVDTTCTMITYDTEDGDCTLFPSCTPKPAQSASLQRYQFNRSQPPPSVSAPTDCSTLTNIYSDSYCDSELCAQMGNTGYDWVTGEWDKCPGTQHDCWNYCITPTEAQMAEHCVVPHKAIQFTEDTQQNCAKTCCESVGNCHIITISTTKVKNSDDGIEWSSDGSTWTAIDPHCTNNLGDCDPLTVCSDSFYIKSKDVVQPWQFYMKVDCDTMDMETNAKVNDPIQGTVAKDYMTGQYIKVNDLTARGPKVLWIEKMTWAFDISPFLLIPAGGCDEGWKLKTTTTCDFDPDHPVCIPKICHPQPVVPHSTVAGTPIYGGEGLTYSCETGYTLDALTSGLTWFVVHCTPSGVFTAAQECKRIQCLEVPPVAHASYVDKLMFYGDEIVYTCDVGYSTNELPQEESNRAFSPTCRLNGELEVMERCEAIECQYPAQKTYSTYPVVEPQVKKYYMDTLRFNCKNGWSVDGLPSGFRSYDATCKESGNFEDGGDCQDINWCHGTNSTKCGNGTCRDQELIYTCDCDVGYKLETDPTGHTCKEIDECVEWKGTEKCLEPNHGKCTDALNNYHCTCDPGYTVEMLPCEYRDLCEACQILECGYPPPHLIAFASTRMDQKLNFGDTASYFCYPGYTTDPSDIQKNFIDLKCEANGFSSTPSKCVPAECPLPTVANATQVLGWANLSGVPNTGTNILFEQKAGTVQHVFDRWNFMAGTAAIQNNMARTIMGWFKTERTNSFTIFECGNPYPGRGERFAFAHRSDPTGSPASYYTVDTSPNGPITWIHPPQESGLAHKWIFFAHSWDPDLVTPGSTGKHKLYVDKTVYAEATDGELHTGALGCGFGDLSSGHPFRGQFKGVKVSSRVWSESEIFDYYDRTHQDSIDMVPPDTPVDVTCTFTASEAVDKVYVDGVEKTASDVTGDWADKTVAKTLTFTSAAKQIAISSHHFSPAGCSGGGLAISCDSTFGGWKLSSNSKDGWKVYGASYYDDATLPDALHPPMRDGKEWHEADYVPGANFYPPSDAGVDSNIVTEGQPTEVFCDGNLKYNKNWYFFVFTNPSLLAPVFPPAPHTVGYKTQYKCNLGYTNDGTTNGATTTDVLCDTDAVYKPSTVACKPRECGILPTIPHTTFAPCSGCDPSKMTLNQTATYTCDPTPGYTIEGTAGGTSTFVVMCKHTGSFVGQQSCQPNKCIVPDYPNAVTHYDFRVFRQKLNVRCNPGYKANNRVTFTVTCQADGTFSAHENCSRLSCGVPPNKDFSTPTLTDPVLYQGEVTYACIDGYSTDGKTTGDLSFTVTCDQQGRFTPDEDCYDINYCEPNPCTDSGGTCEDCSTRDGGTCVNPDTSLYGSDWPGFLQKKKSSYLYGENGKWQCLCNDNFEIKISVGGVAAPLTCSNDDCQHDKCGEGGVCEDLSAHHEMAQENAYTCDCADGYNLILDYESDIHNKEPYCDPTVCDPVVVDNTYPDKQHYDKHNALVNETRDVVYLEKVKYTCSHGYTTYTDAGEKTWWKASCQSTGELTPILTCVPVRCPQSALTDGMPVSQSLILSRTVDNPWTVGERAKIRCSVGYRADEISSPFGYEYVDQYPYECPAGSRPIKSPDECANFEKEYTRRSFPSEGFGGAWFNSGMAGGCQFNDQDYIVYYGGFSFCKEFGNVASGPVYAKHEYGNAHEKNPGDGDDLCWASDYKPVLKKMVCIKEPALLQQRKSAVSALVSLRQKVNSTTTSNDCVSDPADAGTCVPETWQTQSIQCPQGDPVYSCPAYNCERNVVCCKATIGYTTNPADVQRDCEDAAPDGLGLAYHVAEADEYGPVKVLCCAHYIEPTQTTTTTTLQRAPMSWFCDDTGGSLAEYVWSNRVQWKDAPPPQAPFTLIVRFSTTQGYEQVMVSWAAEGAKQSGITFGLTSQGFLKYTESYQGEVDLTGSVIVLEQDNSVPEMRLNDGYFHTAVVIRDETGKASLYRDGELVAQNTVFQPAVPQGLLNVAAGANLVGDGQKSAAEMTPVEQKMFYGSLGTMRYLNEALDATPRITNDWPSGCQMILATCQADSTWDVNQDFRCVKKECVPLRAYEDGTVKPSPDHGVKQLLYGEDYRYDCIEGYFVDQTAGINFFIVDCRDDQKVHGYRQCIGRICEDGLYKPQYSIVTIAGVNAGDVKVTCPLGTATPAGVRGPFHSHCGKYGRLEADWPCYPFKYSVRGHLYDAGSATKRTANSLTLSFHKLADEEDVTDVDRGYTHIEGQWKLGAEGESCTTVCERESLKCYETSQVLHNGDVHTRYMLKQTMAGRNYNCQDYSFDQARQKWSPGVDTGSGKCLLSAVDRLFNTFDCGHGQDAVKRLCYCMAPFDTGENGVVSDVQAGPDGFYQVSLYRGKWEVKVSCLNNCDHYTTSVFSLTVNHETGMLPRNYTAPSGNFEPDLVSDFYVRRELTSSEMRLALSWGSAPQDLDAVLVYGESVRCDSTQEPICTSTCETSAQSRAECVDESTVKAVLQRDATESYGPESIFVKNIGKCKPSFNTNCAAVFLIRCTEEIPYILQQEESLGRINPEAVVFRGGQVGAAGVYHMQQSDHNKKEIVLYTINTATGQVHSGYHDPWSECPPNKWCVWVYSDGVLMEGPPSQIFVVDRLADAAVTFGQSNAFRAVQWANLMSGDYKFFVKTDQQFDFSINSQEPENFQPLAQGGTYQETADIQLGEGLYLLDLQIAQETTLPDLYWKRSGSETTYTHGALLCAVPGDLDAHIHEWVGSGCASGSKIESGATCTIVPKVGSVCSSPGRCTSGEWETAATCGADPMPSDYKSWLSTDQTSIGMQAEGTVSRVSAITDRKADATPIVVNNAGVGADVSDFVSWSQENGFKLTNGNTIELPEVEGRGEWTMYLAFKTGKAGAQVIASSKPAGQASVPDCSGLSDSPACGGIYHAMGNTGYYYDSDWYTQGMPDELIGTTCPGTAHPNWNYCTDISVEEAVHHCVVLRLANKYIRETREDCQKSCCESAQTTVPCPSISIGIGDTGDAPENTNDGAFYLSSQTLDSSGACVQGPSVVSDGSYNSNHWRWVEIYGSSTKYELYFDGGVTQTTDIPSSAWSSNDVGGIMADIAHLKLGSEKNSEADPYFDGYIKDVIVFNRALTDQEKAKMHVFYDKIIEDKTFLEARLATLPNQ